MTTTLTIDGMSCGGCVTSVRGALERIGVREAEVEVGRAQISWDETAITREQIVEAIEDAGFEVTGQG